MPRQPRIDLPDIPQHTVQRGNDRQPTFVADADRLRYLTDLNEISLRVGPAKIGRPRKTDRVHHVLVTPLEIGAIGRMMQLLGRNYVGQFNARRGRTGTLWEGRYKSGLVADADYFLRCVRYIDLNPVRARMTDDPAVFPWSSCAGLCGMRDDPLLTPHPTQRELGTSDKERGDAYKALLSEAINDEDLAAIRVYLCSNSEPNVATTSARWSKPRPSASLAYGLRIGRRESLPTSGSEPDPVLATPFLPFLATSVPRGSACRQHRPAA